MAVSQQQKVDFLLKKLGFTKTKTGLAVDSTLTGTKKAGFAEAIPSPLIIANSSLWNEADSIPATPPGSDTNQVKVYLAASSGHRMTVDSTVANNRAFIAFSTYNNSSSTRLNNWIDTQFGAGYLIKVFKGDPNSGGVQLSAAGSGQNDGWFFDYSAGVLNFNDTNVPSGVQTDNIYIVGYRYIGQTGAPTSGISTFSHLDLTVERNLDVGVQGGISTFRNNIDLNGNIDVSGNLDVDGHTNLDNVSIAGLTTMSDDLRVDGNIRVQASSGYGFVKVFDGNPSGGGSLIVGDNSDLFIYHGGHNYYDSYNNARHIFMFNGSEVACSMIPNNKVSLYYDNVAKFETATSGVKIVGTTTSTQLAITGISTFTGAIDANGDLDVDGHTNLDNISVSGVSTFNGDANFGGNVSIAGTLTYEDVKNVDSVGIVTARNGVDCNGDLDVDGHTNLDNVSIAGVSTFAGAIDLNADLDVDGHTELDNANISGIVTAAQIRLPSAQTSNSNNNRFYIGDAAVAPMQIYYDGNNNNSTILIQNGTGGLNIRGEAIRIRNIYNTNTSAEFNAGSDVRLRYNNSLKFATTNTGINVTGNTVADGLVIDGDSDLNGDLDVDGHTNLDNVSIAGVTTTSGLLDANGLIEATAGENKIPSLYSAMTNLPAAGSYHGMFAHVHATGRGYFAHAGNWLELVNKETNGTVGTGTETYNIGTLNVKDLDVDQHTNLDNVSIAGVTTAAGTLRVGTGHTFHDNGNAQISGIATVYNQLNIPRFYGSGNPTTQLLTLGADEIRMYQRWNGSTSTIEFKSTGAFIGHPATAASAPITIQSGSFTRFKFINSNGGSGTYAEFNKSGTGGYVQLHGESNTKVLTTDANGVNILKDIDVDGHTNLDNVSVAGVTTFASTAVFGSTITAGGSTGNNGEYLKSTGSGVDWGSFPSLRTKQTFTASSGQTTFNFAYTIGFLDVYVNGIKLADSEFTATNGTSTVLAVGCFVGDIVELVAYNTVSNYGGAFGIGNLVEDLSPQLGGDLDLFNKSITGTGNVNITGIISATTFRGPSGVTATFVGDGSGLTGITASGSGVVIKNSGSVVGTAGTIDFGSNLSVSPASAGIVTITATGGGGSGISTISGVVNIANDLDVDGHTNLDNVSISGVTTFANSVHAQTINAVTFAGNGDFVELDVDGHTNLDNVSVAGVSTFVGAINVASGDIRSNALTLKNAAGGATYATFTNGGAATLNFNNTPKLSTSNTGITVTGTVAATSYTGDGSQLTGITAGISTISGVVNIVNDLDVDGHTNLDNVSIAGVVTATTFKGALEATSASFSGNIDANGDLDVDGHTNLDNVSVAGVVTATTFSGSFIGNGSGLTGVVASGSGIVIKDDGSTVGTAGTVNFTEPITVTPLSAGITTVGINTSQFNLERLNVSGISTFQTASAYTFTVGAGNLTVNGNAIYGSSKIMFLGGGGGDMAYYSGGSSYSDHIFRTLQGGSQIERFRINSSAAISVAGSYGNAGQVLTSNGSGSATTWTTVSGGGADVGITTNLSGTFTASAGTPSTINTFTGYSSDDLVVEYTIYIKNGSDFQTQKLLAMRDGTTIHSTQFAVMFSSSLLVQCDATISSGNILLRATPETGVSGSTTYKIKREVM